MEIFPEFPPGRMDDPKRRAEKEIYEQLAQSTVPGFALYEPKPSIRAPQIDYAIWLERVARIALSCKGGTLRIERGEWYLQTLGGWQRKPSPVDPTWDSAMAMREAIERNLGRGGYIVPVLLLPNMKYDPVIHGRALEQNVEVMFGGEDIVERLLELADGHHIKYPPTGFQIQQEAEVIMPALAQPPQAEPLPRIVIQHADTIHVHVTTEDIQAGLLNLPQTE